MSFFFSAKKKDKKLIAWNFASSVVHQRANRKFPRRYFKENGETMRTRLKGYSRGRNGLGGYGSSEQQSICKTVHVCTVSSELAKRSGCNTRRGCFAISCNVVSKALIFAQLFIKKKLIIEKVNTPNAR